LANSGSLLETVTGPAHTVTNTYETNRNVLTNKENKAGVNIRSNFAYTVNDLGQRDDISRSGTAFASANTETWNYNAKGEIAQADHSTNNAFDRSFDFDSIGNRKKSANSLTLPATDNYTSNALNQYSAVGVVARTFDDDGNLTNDGTKQFVWDAENRLIAVKQDTVTVAEYAYDAYSRRITKDVTGVLTNFVYDGWNPIAKFTGTILSKTYTWGMDVSGSMQGAGGVGGLLAVNDTTATYYPSFDGNGNVSEYVDSTGTVVAHYEYDAFGQAVGSGTKKNDFSHQFSTKQLDTETGLHYYGYRYYDSTSGRWLGRDPIEEEGGYNLYGFIENNGVNKLDYLGMAEFWFNVDDQSLYDIVLSLGSDNETQNLGTFDLSLTTEEEILKKTKGKCAIVRYRTKASPQGNVTTLANITLFENKEEYEAELKREEEIVQKALKEQAEAFEKMYERIAVVQTLMAIVRPKLEFVRVASVTGAGARSLPVNISKIALPKGAALDSIEGAVGVINMKTQGGVGTFMGSFSRVGRTLFVQGAHSEGQVAWTQILRFAKEVGRLNGYTRIMLQGAARSTGANPGHVPKPILIKIIK
jgi:RHS repeat-associated protein